MIKATPLCVFFFLIVNVWGAETAESFDLADTASAADKVDHHFKAEINQLMKLIINSLYSNRDIFVRELVSNAADALDKIRYISLTDSQALAGTPALEIKIKADPENKMLHFRDTGIGMTQADLLNNLGSIAKSGTKDFVKQVQAGKSDLTQIGQFGVGFYSAFLVADKVTVTSKNNKDDQYIWESTMDDAASFTVYKDPRGNTLGRGTQISLHIKDDAAEYLSPARLKELVRHYNEFTTFPVYVWDERTEEVPAEPKPEPEAEKTTDETEVEETEEIEETEPAQPTTRIVWGWDQTNTAQPLWTRPSSEITPEEYQKFFASLGDYQDPITYTHFRVEGELEFTTLVYIPATPPPANYDFASLKSNVKLYVKRVFISEKFDDLMPSYLSFVKGVVDSDDLPLHVSRETLQQSKILKAMQRKLTRNVIQMIQDLSHDENKTKFEEFHKNYHQYLKAGLTRDNPNRDRLAKLLRFHSTLRDEQISFEQYVENMKEGQNSIYYLGGEELAIMKKSPLLERASKKGIEVLLFNSPIDEYMAQALGKYDKKYQLVDISKSGLQLEGDTPKEELTETFKPLLDYLNDKLKSKIMRVEVTSRLTSTPCALVTPQWAMSSNMERIVKAQALQEGQPHWTRGFKKILEINPRHPIIKKLLATVQESAQNDETADIALLLVDTAALHSGVTLEDPLVVANRLDKVISHALNVDPSEALEEETIEELPTKAEEKKEENPPVSPEFNEDL